MLKPTNEDEWNELIDCDLVQCLFFMSYQDNKSMEIYNFMDFMAKEFEGRVKVVCADGDALEEV